MDIKFENTLSQSHFFSEELPSRFLTAAQQICGYAKQLDIDVVATDDNNLPIFRKLDFARQLEAVEKVETLSDVYSAVISSGGSLNNAASLVWMACNKFGLRPPSDFFDKLSDEDVIEVYCQENIHQFSNLKFFEICSYTLEQIYCYPWPLLWHREEMDVNYIQGAIQQMAHPEQKTTIHFNGPAHKVTEILSPLRFKTNYSLRCGAPLFCRDTKEKRGVIVCESVSLNSKLSGLEEERMLMDYEKHRKALKSDNVVELGRFLRTET